MKAHRLRRLHAIATVAWSLTLIPTLIWWRDSVLWVSFMSLYAILISHVTAWQAARAEQASSDDAR